jgi:hypothetical protein
MGKIKVLLADDFDSRTRPGKSLFKIMTIEFKDYEEFLLRTDIRTPWDALSLLENTENNYQMPWSD